MFKRIAKAFRTGKKRPRKPARTSRPGEGIRQLAAALPGTDDAPAPPQPSPEPVPEPRDEPTREALISEAMRIRDEKAEVLKDLPARDRAKLRKLAEKMLLGGIADDDEGETEKPTRTRH
ncbi:MAG: hypothetical protein HN403_13610 [Rhodospirillales bacterium]|jgi:hypothetical protein|nr:hypothetical protein [Rhodospirillales bacterium]